ncbi:MAG: NAD-dependent DNA ligase LigA [Thermaerobacter sp.]|nr:NAD-dependent DNA ligase LigA [Thermaerobacter sp.]
MNGGGSAPHDADVQNDRMRWDALTREVRRHQLAYHRDDAPIVPDAEYDRLVAELEELARRHPDWGAKDSPAARVGAKGRSTLAPVRFTRPVLSLNNAHSREELAEFMARVGVPGPWLVEMKIDGLSVILRYRQGGLVLAATRGDGSMGEDVTANAATVAGIPSELSAPVDVEVRGEVYLAKSRLAALNADRAARGEALLANPRNAAAGSLRQLDPTITAARGLSAFVYEIREAEEPPATQGAALARLASLGFAVEPHWQRCADLEAVWQFVQQWSEERRTLDYDTDGLVVKLDDLGRAARLGATQKAPRAAVAFKYPPDEDVATVLGIRLTVGRTGAVTPTAELSPVQLGGTTVTRASLHNANILERLDVRVGDRVVVRKAGEIIPEIVSVLSTERTGSEGPFVYPDACPDCGTPLVREPDEVDIRCPAALTCPAQRREGLIHYGSRGALDIAGLGDKTVDQLLSAGWLATPVDLYALSADRLAELPRFGPVAADNLVRAVAASRSQPLSRLLVAFGIRHVGERVAAALAGHFRTLDALMAADADEVAAVPGVGSIIAGSVVAFFEAPAGQALVEGLRRAGVNFAEPEGDRGTEEGPLSGQSVVITGTLAHASRREAEEAVTRGGGRVQSAVTRQTTLVVAGEGAGSKLARARALEIEVVDEQEFWSRVANESPP